ncbi:hypothetical protein [Tengunoibacter tsumagoiensis]|uniref:Uncharacterized protein n=1 Tax=Tengunoibacter tsumagoiensis TaxID=2014871 RepID=A0A402A0K9_9CHLR|nr:hypothetical protein [Tengunoibacter tsumagoiensis]GCE12615.1 hypothetical protein KTT_24740 [Tengunoibacter tsumagoiensis]
MNVPLQLGWQQVVLLLIAIAGIGLLIWSVMGLFVLHKQWEEYEDERGRIYGRWKHRRRFRWKHSIGGIIALLFAISLLWLTFAVQTYLGLTNNIKVATVRATPIANFKHQMSLDLTLYNSDGTTTTKTYGVYGDEWMLQGDIVKFPDWMNIIGVHSGFKITRLEGRYDDPNLERSAERTVVELNGGDDNFFTTVQNQSWTNPFVQAAYGSGTFLKADGKTYDVFVSQDALTPRPAK